MSSRKRQLFAVEDVVGMLMNGTLPDECEKEINVEPPAKRTSLPGKAETKALKLVKEKFYRAEESRPKSENSGRIRKVESQSNDENLLPDSGNAAIQEFLSATQTVCSRSSLPGKTESVGSPRFAKANWSTKFFQPSPNRNSFCGSQRKPQSPFTNWLKKAKDKAGENIAQTVLDVGQKEFGVVQCKECSMVYELKSPDDELLHIKHHESMKEVLSFPNALASKFSPVKVTAQGFQIYQVSKDVVSQKSLVSKSESVLDIIKRELSRISDQYWIEKISSRQKIYICVNPLKLRITGICVVEPVARAFPAESITWPLVILRTPRKCVAGIRMLWVSPENRKQGIAKELMDGVRSTFIYGCILTKRDLALSMPTQSGFDFFKGYLCGISRETKSPEHEESVSTNKGTFLVYES